ncbi:Integrase core domain protein [compost metagenome]
MNSNNEFSPIVGEHYSYHGHAYEIVEIIADRYQLRSLERCGTITFHRFDRLERHWRKGRFIRIHEAPLQGAPNKIVADLSLSKQEMFKRRQAYVKAMVEELKCQLNIQLIDTHGEPCERPWLTCLVSIHSRRILGWKISRFPSSPDKTLCALKSSLNTEHLRTGLRRVYIIDKPEFFNEKFRVMLATMGGTPIFCRPGEPNQKPHIERCFKRLKRFLP